MEEKFINEYEAYVIFSTMRLYFMGKYNFSHGFLWNTFTPEKFRKENKINICKRVSDHYQKRYNLIYACAINLAHDPKIYIPEMLTEYAKTEYRSIRSWLSMPVRLTSGELYSISKDKRENALLDDTLLDAVICQKLHPCSYVLLNRASLIEPCSVNAFRSSVKNRLTLLSKFIILSQENISDITEYSKTLKSTILSEVH